MAYVIITSQTALAVVFGVSAYMKVRNRASFEALCAAIRSLGLVPETCVPTVAGLLILAEAVTVPLVVVPHTTLAGFSLAGGLLVLFTLATVIARRRRVVVPCHCFGAVSSGPFGGVHLVRNALLMASVLTGGIALHMGVAGERTQSGGVVAVAATAGVVTATLLVSLEELVQLFRASPHHATAPASGPLDS